MGISLHILRYFLLFVFGNFYAKWFTFRTVRGKVIVLLSFFCIWRLVEKAMTPEMFHDLLFFCKVPLFHFL